MLGIVVGTEDRVVENRGPIEHEDRRCTLSGVYKHHEKQEG